MLATNKVVILKFMLHVSRDEQKKRLVDRLTDPKKNWKFRAGDLDDRALWDDFTKAYHGILSNTSTEAAPWYIVPADDKARAQSAGRTDDCRPPRDAPPSLSSRRPARFSASRSDEASLGLRWGPGKRPIDWIVLRLTPLRNSRSTNSSTTAPMNATKMTPRQSPEWRRHAQLPK